MLLSVADTPETCPASCLCRENPSFFLSEYLDVPGTFYIGSDAHEDGKRLGEAYLAHFRRFSRVVCLSSHANGTGAAVWKDLPERS